MAQQLKGLVWKQRPALHTYPMLVKYRRTLHNFQIVFFSLEIADRISSLRHLVRVEAVINLPRCDPGNQ